MTDEENEKMPDSIGNIDNLLWFMENSEVFKFYILGAASRFFLENEEIIKRDIQLRRKGGKKGTVGGEKGDGGCDCANVVGER